MSKLKKESIKFKLDEGVETPKYETAQAVGFDVTAQDILQVYTSTGKADDSVVELIKDTFHRNGFLNIMKNTRILFDTGLTVAELPENIELQVRSRSGLSLKQGLVVVNQPGTIDPDYRGKVGIILTSITGSGMVKKGDRIAQLVPKEVIRPEIIAVDDISTTDRGDNGFGSTGV